MGMSMTAYIDNILQSHGVQCINQDYFDVISAIRSIGGYNDDIIYLAYLWVKDTGNSNNKYNDRYKFILEDVNDCRNIFSALRTKFDMGSSISNKLGKSQFDDEINRRIELKYIASLLFTNCFASSNFIKLMELTLSRSPYKEVRDTLEKVQIGKENIGYNMGFWDVIVQKQVIEATKIFGHKIKFSAGAKYCDTYRTIEVSGMDLERLKFITEAMMAMMPANPKKYISKSRMVGKGNGSDIQAVMFLDTLVPIFMLTSEYPRVVTLGGTKILKLLLELAWQDGINSSNFKDRLSRIAVKVDREEILNRRKRFKHITKKIMSDEMLLSKSIYELMDIDSDISKGVYRGKLAT